MYKLELNGQVQTTSGLLKLTEEDYFKQLAIAKEAGALIKFSTNAVEANEGMWAFCVDQAGIDLAADDKSYGKQFLVVVANDSVVIPPMSAGTIITLETQGAERPKLHVDAFIAQVAKTLNDDTTLSIIADIWKK